MKTKISIWWLIVLAIVFFALLRQCNGEVKIVKETETITKIVTDTLTVKEIVEIKKPVYVEKIKTLKGKDSIIYRDKPSDQTITARQFNTELESNEAKADLLITSTGEVLDVQGTIQYSEKETITTITKTKNASGLFIYGSVPINNFSSPEIGLIFQFKNKVGIMAGAQFNSITNKPDIKAGLLIKL